MKKRLVSLLLTLALLVLPVVSAGAAQPDPTLVQTQTETAEAAQHQYSYIALGDSIVAGIGLPDAVYQRNGRYYDVSGNYQGYSKDCYVARGAEGLGLSRDQTANYGMPALMSGDLLELVRTGSCQSASINFSLPDLREELKHAQVITVEIGANDVLVPIMYGIASAMGGPQVFEALLPMLEGDFRQMDASSFAALRENLDSLNITAQQRNALLKPDAKADMNAVRQQLYIWDEQLSQAGAEIMRMRAEFVQRLGLIASRLHRQISGEREALLVRYAPDVDIERMGGGDAEAALSEALYNGALDDIRCCCKRNVFKGWR